MLENIDESLPENEKQDIATLIENNMAEITRRLLRDDLSFEQEMQTFTMLYLTEELAAKEGIDLTPYHEERNKLLEEKCKYAQEFRSAIANCQN